MQHKESFTLNAENLLTKIKELIGEGNVRKVTIADKAGKELMSFPVTIGILAALMAPVLTAVGALAAYTGEYTVIVERRENAL